MIFAKSRVFNHVSKHYEYLYFFFKSLKEFNQNSLLELIKCSEAEFFHCASFSEIRHFFHNA